MKRTWDLQAAGSELERVISAAEEDGPQFIREDGVDKAVLMSIEDYRSRKTVPRKLSQFLRESPLAGTDLDLSRDRSPLRD